MKEFPTWMHLSHVHTHIYLYYYGGGYMMYVGYSKIAYLTLFKKTCNAFMDDLLMMAGKL